MQVSRLQLWDWITAHTRTQTHSAQNQAQWRCILIAYEMDFGWMGSIVCVCSDVHKYTCTFYPEQQTKTKIIMDFMSIKQSFHSLCNLACNESEKYMRFRHKVWQCEMEQ